MRLADAASSIASTIVCPSTNCRPSNCTARSVAATTDRAPSLARIPVGASPSGNNFLLIAMAVLDSRASALSPAASKSARPNWSAVSAIAVSASGTRSKASASRIRAKPSALEMGYSLSRLSIAQNGGGFCRTACTQGVATWAAAAQFNARPRVPRRWATMSSSGRYGLGRRMMQGVLTKMRSSRNSCQIFIQFLSLQ